MSEPLSSGFPSGRRSTTCGYCFPPGQRSAARSSYHSAGLDATQLSCKVYQQMIDRGWRRSGTFCYKPDLRYSCCPQYTIRLDASAFKPSKSQRKLVNRWNRYVLHGKDGEAMDVDGPKQHGHKTKNTSFSLTTSIHAAELEFLTNEHPAHRLEVTLEPSSYSLEKYELYQKYQEEIHHDTHNTPSSFRRFLVHSPLVREPISYTMQSPPHLPKDYGSYHQLYRLDGELIAMAVIDILPSCVSSVYFLYDKQWEKFSFGKLSAMREASLAHEMKETGAPGMNYLYMGFYIFSCPKMRYKADYSPSYLADPVTYQWYPLKDCIPLLEKNRYACFSDPSLSIKGNGQPDDTSYPSPGEELMQCVRVKLTHRGKSIVVPIKMTNIARHKESLTEVEECIQALGAEVLEEVVLSFGT